MTVWATFLAVLHVLHKVDKPLTFVEIGRPCLQYEAIPPDGGGIFPRRSFVMDSGVTENALQSMTA
jgi:hypothetical protein